MYKMRETRFLSNNYPTCMYVKAILKILSIYSKGM